MEDLFGIDARRQAVADNIQKALGAGYEPEGTDENTEVQKACSGVYADTRKNRRLNRVGQKYGGNGKPDEDGGGKRQPKQEDEPKGGNEKKQEESGEKKTQDMSSHASKASDGALKRAAADEKAPKEVRDAANAELKKRGGGKEEQIDKKKGNEKLWNSVFKKLKHDESGDLYDSLWELGQEYDVDLDDYGDEEEMMSAIKEKIPYHKVANVLNGGKDEKTWNSIFKKLRHDEDGDYYDSIWELGQKYDIDLDDYGDEEEMKEVIMNNIPIKEVQKIFKNRWK